MHSMTQFPKLQSFMCHHPSFTPNHLSPISPDLKTNWTSLVVQWIESPANAEEMGLIPSPGRFYMLQSN